MKLKEFVNNPNYVAFVIFVIMPLNGYIMASSFWFGFILCIAQLPWFLSNIVPKLREGNET